MSLQINAIAPLRANSTFEDHCLAGELTFGNPLQGSCVVREAVVLNSECEAVQKRARVQGQYTFASRISRRESNEEEKKTWFADRNVKWFRGGLVVKAQ